MAVRQVAELQDELGVGRIREGRLERGHRTAHVLARERAVVVRHDQDTEIRPARRRLCALASCRVAVGHVVHVEAGGAKSLRGALARRPYLVEQRGIARPSGGHPVTLIQPDSDPFPIRPEQAAAPGHDLGGLDGIEVHDDRPDPRVGVRGERTRTRRIEIARDVDPRHGSPDVLQPASQQARRFAEAACRGKQTEHGDRRVGRAFRPWGVSEPAQLHPALAAAQGGLERGHIRHGDAISAMRLACSVVMSAGVPSAMILPLSMSAARLQLLWTRSSPWLAMTSMPVPAR